MLTRPIPSTGEAMSVIGLGTLRAFDAGTDEATRRPLREVVQLLLDTGGRMIDSSPMYGRAEAVTGDLLAELAARPRAFIATKVWTTGSERGVEQMRRSARLLSTNTIDLMQIHNLVDWRTHLTSLRRMKEEGHIRYIGSPITRPEHCRSWRAFSPASQASTSSSSAIRWRRGRPRPKCCQWPRRAVLRLSPISRSSAQICSAGCAGARYRIGRANSTARVGRNYSSNISSPSLPSPA